MRLFTFFVLIFFSVIEFSNAEIFIEKTGLIGDEIKISTQIGDQETPKVIYLKDKNLWFVVWADNRNGNNDIYGQFVKSDGSLCGSEIRLTNVADTGHSATHPSLTYNGNGTIVFAWQDTRSSDMDGDGDIDGYIYVNYIDISSMDVDPNNNIPDCSDYTFNTNNEIYIPYESIDGDNLISRQKPDIKYDPVNNRYILAYIEKRNDFSKVVCFSSGNPTLFSKDNISNTYVGYAILNSTLTVSTTDILRNDRNPISDAVRAREIISNKESFKESHTLEFYNGIDSVKVAIDTTSNNQFLIYEAKKQIVEFTCNCTDDDSSGDCNSGDNVSGSLDVKSKDIVNHIYSISLANIPLKNIYTAKIDKDLDANYASHNPDVAFDPYSKRFLIAFENEGVDGNTKIYGQLLKATGGLYGNNILISYQDLDEDGQQDENILNSKQSSPSVAFDPVNQRFFVAWQDGRNSSISVENLDIYGQYIDSEGSLRGKNYIISKAPYNQRNPSIAYNTHNDEFIAVWKDARNANIRGADIYGQRYNLGQPQVQFKEEFVDPNEGVIIKPLQPPLLDFGTVMVGESRMKTFKIENTGDDTLYIDCLKENNTTSLVYLNQENETNNIVFLFRDLPEELYNCDDDKYIYLLPGTSLSLSLNFIPLDDASYSTELIFVTNSSSENTIRLQGVGYKVGVPGNENSSDSGNNDSQQNTTGSTNIRIPKVQTSGGCFMGSKSDYSLLLILIGISIITIRRIKNAEKVA